MREFLDALHKGGEAIDPVEAARASLKRKLPARFFGEVMVADANGGHGVLLDGKPLRTPGRQPLICPTRAAAELVAAEWSACGDHIDPAAMPATRLANSALDGVAAGLRGVMDDLVRHAGADLLCYRAETPAELTAQQARRFDPVLDRFARRHGARFVLAAGVTHVAQPQAAIAAYAKAAAAFARPFPLTCLHAMATLTGSALLALDVAEGGLDAAAAWQAAHVDEDWNIARWGVDDEAAARRQSRWLEMRAAARLLAAALADK
jgi:chaperone required for assembly of F1-ATPase